MTTSKTQLKPRIKNASDKVAKLTGIIAKAKEKSAMLSPTETADILEDVVETLQSVEEELTGMASEEPTEEPKEQIAKTLDDDKEDEDLKTKVASLESDMKMIKSWAMTQQKEKLASDYSALFADPKVREAKANEILQSKDDLVTLEARVREAKAMKEQFTGKERVASMKGYPIHAPATKQRDASMGSVDQGRTALDFSRV